MCKIESEHRFKWLPMVVFIGITLLPGAAVALLTSGSMDVYAQIVKPEFAPPAWVFPVAWSILYVLMAVSAWLVWRKNRPDRRTALALYALQLAVNLAWPWLFFVLRAFGLAFVWLVLLWMLVAAMMVWFARTDKTACWLNVPYLVWLTFAGALNFMIAWLNR